MERSQCDRVHERTASCSAMRHPAGAKRNALGMAVALAGRIQCASHANARWVWHASVQCAWHAHCAGKQGTAARLNSARRSCSFLTACVLVMYLAAVPSLPCTAADMACNEQMRGKAGTLRVVQMCRASSEGAPQLAHATHSLAFTSRDFTPT